MRTREFVASIVATACLMSAPAAAQSPPAAGALPPGSDLERLRQSLLQEVRVTDAAGYQRTGLLQSFEGDQLRIVTAGTPTVVPISSVRRIERRGDSLRNGLLIGAAAGAFGLGLSYGEASIGGARALPFFAFGIGVYALIGAGIDALHNGWTTVQRP